MLSSISSTPVGPPFWVDQQVVCVLCREKGNWKQWNIYPIICCPIGFKFATRRISQVVSCKTHVPLETFLVTKTSRYEEIVISYYWIQNSVGILYFVSSKTSILCACWRTWTVHSTLGRFFSCRHNASAIIARHRRYASVSIRRHNNNITQ